MTDKTENREYNVPEAGEKNWHEPINENWHLIDEDVQEVLETAQAALEAATDNGESTDGDENSDGDENTDSGESSDGDDES